MIASLHFARFVHLVLAVGAVSLSIAATAQVSLNIDLKDLKSKEIEAKYTTGIGTKEVAWVTDAQAMPSVTKQSSGCARIPEYMDGAVCYRVCGGSLPTLPVKWTYEWRQANIDHNLRWEACAGDGCRGVQEQYYQGAGRGCGHFMIWKGLKHERDLRIRIQLP